MNKTACKWKIANVTIQQYTDLLCCHNSQGYSWMTCLAIFHVPVYSNDHDSVISHPIPTNLVSKERRHLSAFPYMVLICRLTILHAAGKCPRTCLSSVVWPDCMT